MPAELSKLMAETTVAMCNMVMNREVFEALRAAGRAHPQGGCPTYEDIIKVTPEGDSFVVRVLDSAEGQTPWYQLYWIRTDRFGEIIAFETRSRMSWQQVCPSVRELYAKPELGMDGLVIGE